MQAGVEAIQLWNSDLAEAGSAPEGSGEAGEDS